MRCFLRRFLEEFVFTARPAVVRAVVSYRMNAADFSDYLIEESAAVAGASAICTFDRTL